MDSKSRLDPYIAHELKTHANRIVGVVFLIRPDEKFLFVRTKRLPNQWQPIGGGVKPGDSSVVSAAIREVEEEVGIELMESDLNEVFCTAYDFGQGSVYFFAAAITKIDVLSFDTSELEEWRWVSLEEAINLPVFPATEECLRYLTAHRHKLKAKT